MNKYYTQLSNSHPEMIKVEATLSIEKSIEEIEEPRDLKITIIGRDGEEKIHFTPLDENFTLKKAFGVE